mmetsp:Transcript_16059/g.26715  ORF Transcript_16059/g.26715 Transcript_16059/m.26715 type:complete len:232 (-) Transcript_16059:416-1111(-)
MTSPSAVACSSLAKRTDSAFCASSLSRSPSVSSSLRELITTRRNEISSLPTLATGAHELRTARVSAASSSSRLSRMCSVTSLAAASSSASTGGEPPPLDCLARPPAFLRPDDPADAAGTAPAAGVDERAGVVIDVGSEWQSAWAKRVVCMRSSTSMQPISPAAAAAPPVSCALGRVGLSCLSLEQGASLLSRASGTPESSERGCKRPMPWLRHTIWQSLRSETSAATKSSE